MTAFNSLQCSCEGPLAQHSFLERRRVLRGVVRAVREEWPTYEKDMAGGYFTPEDCALQLAERVANAEGTGRMQTDPTYGSIIAIVLLTVLLAVVSAVVQWLVKRWLDHHHKLNFAEFEGDE